MINLIKRTNTNNLTTKSNNMKNLITISLITIFTFTSCQKDFYLTDLNYANQTIENQNGIISSQNDLINSLQVDVSNDQIIISGYTLQLSNANISIDSLNGANAIQVAELDSLNTTINTLINNITEINVQLVNVNTDLLSALNNADTLSSTITELRSEITALEGEIASFVPEIVTVIEYVERYHTNTVTVIEEVEVINTVTVINDVIVENHIYNTFTKSVFVINEIVYTRIQSTHAYNHYHGTNGIEINVGWSGGGSKTKANYYGYKLFNISDRSLIANWDTTTNESQVFENIINAIN